MQYLLLIYDREQDRIEAPPAAGEALYGEYLALVHELRAAGKYVGGNPLQPTATATTVRVRDGKTQMTDGPFAETKEQLGGYFLIEAADLDEATRIAARLPTARFGSIEVRPIRVHAEM
jgi:hypothetical protein